MHKSSFLECGGVKGLALLLIAALFSMLAFASTANAEEKSDASLSASASSVNRLYGNDCFGTNLATLKKDVELYGLSEGIIVCTNTHYVDSLSASALSGLLDYPIVIVNGVDNQMNSTVKQSMNVVSNSGKKKLDIVIIGGTAAISSGIESQLKSYDSDGKCDRIYGSDGYKTNLAIYDYGKKKNGGWDEEVFVATGTAYYDALGVASIAANYCAFVFLVNPNGDNSEMLNKIGDARYANIMGGTAAVKQDVEKAIKNKGCKVYRYAGKDAYETNIIYMKWVYDWGSMRSYYVGICTGTGYWDALGSSHTLGYGGFPILLMNPNESLNQGAYDLLKTWKSKGLEGAYIFGGTSAITKSTESNIKTIFG